MSLRSLAMVSTAVTASPVFEVAEQTWLQRAAEEARNYRRKPVWKTGKAHSENKAERRKQDADRKLRVGLPRIGKQFASEEEKDRTSNHFEHV